MRKLMFNIQMFAEAITRNDAAALIPEETSREIITGIEEQSVVLRMFKKLPNMSRKQTRIPVMNSLPSAYFVNGDTGLKGTTKVSWDNVFINAEEIATIVPIPEAVLDDADYDIWGEVKPKIEEAIGALIDGAALFGVNKPELWPVAILDNATTKGNVVTLGTGTDIYDDIMGEDGVIAKVEEDGFGVDGHVAALNMKAKLRGLRDKDGQPIFVTNMQGATNYALDGEQMFFSKNGSFDVSKALMISGNFGQAVYSVRQDMTYKVLDQAVITDADGKVLYNLAQQDMIALRVVMRLGWALPQPAVRLEATTPYPFAALLPASPVVS